MPTYDSAYVSRRNIVHAYDVILQPDAATRSGNVTLSVADILSVQEWFFRVNRALKIFEGYIPYELATASAVPAIYADDLSIIYDLGASINAIKTASAFDKLITDYATYTKSYSPLFFSILRRKVPIVYKTLSVLDTIAVSERVDYTKSYNTLFFSLFQRRAPIRYITLSVSDGFDISDYASVKKIIVVSAGDSVIADSASAKGVVAVPVSDYGLLVDVSDLRNRAIAVYDIIPVIDYGTAVKAKVLEVLDYISVADSVDLKKAVAVTALEKLITDYVTYTKSYSPLFFTLLRRKTPIVYKTLSVLDVIAVKDSLSTVVVKTVPAYDYIGFDSVSYAKSYSPLFFTLFQRKVPIVYKTLSVLDVVAVKDSASVVPIKVVSVLDVVPVADRVDVKNIAISVSDFIMYDYVPSMSPSSIRYRSLYANVGMRTISVFDRITPYESVWVGPRVVTVNARDYLVSDGATVIKRSVHAYDVVVVWENVNIVRL
jgi:hypothetical protein